METNLSDREVVLENLVSRVFHIEDITHGGAQQNYLVRYRGKLRLLDSAAAYDQLANSLKPLAIVPLFRWEDERQVIILVPGNQAAAKPSDPRINLILFLLTLLSVMATGALSNGEETWPSDPIALVITFIVRGLPFAVSMLAILGAHEFGHYLVGRHHGTNVTLPYFIPFPLSPFGTMGAFINMKEPPKNRRVLLDIGLAGPLAGFIVAIPVLLIGLSLSKLHPLPASVGQAAQGFILEGNSLIYLLAKYLVFGQLIPAPVSYGNTPVLLYWLQYFVTGLPFPFGGLDVTLHPVAWAGWGGLLVTAMNLIPAGQLDGGHVFYVLLGRKRALRVFPFILGLLVVLGFVWTGWWIWAALIFFLGRNHAEPLDQITTLDDRRKILAILGLILFVLTFTPVPLVGM